jgi:hypothetical protein
MRSADGTTGDPELDIIHLSQDHMVDHPAGAHYALWNGPAVLDAGAALQKISATRYQGLMDAAWGVGGWSTSRSR